MILTLTPNPSLDRTVSLAGPLQRGAVQRLTGVVMEPGGKGVNVARVLSNAGRAATAVLPAAEYDPILTALDALELPGLTVHPVPVAGAARINTAVTEPDGTTTKLNELGAGLSEQEIDAVEHALLETLATTPLPAGTTPHHWAVLSGSLPPGVPTDWYARLVKLLREAAPGLCIAVDTSDEPLAALAAELPDSAPDLIKPNGEELGQLTGLPAERAMALEEGAAEGSYGPVVDAARLLVGLGIGAARARRCCPGDRRRGLARNRPEGPGGLHRWGRGLLRGRLHPGRCQRRRRGRAPELGHGPRIGRRLLARHHPAHARRPARAVIRRHPSRMNRRRRQVSGSTGTAAVDRR